MLSPRSLLNVFLAASLGSIALTGISSVEAKAEIEVSLKERYLWLKDSGTFIKRYPIAIGSPETPKIFGVYSILQKVKDPIYYSKSYHKVFPARSNDPVDVRFMPYLKVASDGKVYAIHETAWPRWVHPPSGCCKFGLYQNVE